MALLPVPLGQTLRLSLSVSKRCMNPLNSQSLAFPHRPRPSHSFLRIEARNITRTENAKVRNRRMRRKFNGSPTKPRLSVFCSNKQLYAMLVDDQNKKTLFYANTLQKSIRENCSSGSAIVTAQRVGDELVKVCNDLNITEISSYDRNGFARGERMAAFEIPISQHGFLPR
ncbi:50S ribosomal protein L18, chloroplastic [Cocos nucifera]|uniref:50S ribosomal protein L18, chloroplastic n=1 Tax=Cocos nucifera TaxID=13894 RepID=A0A8K0HZM9_COCNU|nr:50S ribosomal protein L18, chloroplastic [Cocos nucifera]